LPKKTIELSKNFTMGKNLRNNLGAARKTKSNWNTSME